VLRGEPREVPLPRSSHNSSAAAFALNFKLSEISGAFFQDLYILVEMLNGVHVRQPASKDRLFT